MFDDSLYYIILCSYNPLQTHNFSTGKQLIKALSKYRTRKSLIPTMRSANMTVSTTHIYEKKEILIDKYKLTSTKTYWHIGSSQH